jgi:hypothetical protein
MRVRFVGGPSVHPLAHQIGDEYEVSSVHPSGRVYFRGTTGFFAYASYLEPVGSGHHAAPGAPDKM